MNFWDEYESGATRAAESDGSIDRANPRCSSSGAATRASSQNDTTGVCDFCGFASDDVLIGVCADCAPED